MKLTLLPIFSGIFGESLTDNREIEGIRDVSDEQLKADLKVRVIRSKNKMNLLLEV